MCTYAWFLSTRTWHIQLDMLLYWQRSFAIIWLYVGCDVTRLLRIAKWYFESCIVFTQAYPNWEWHSEASSGDILTTPTPNCSSLISVFRVRADRCNRLWVLDSGVMDSIETFKTVCPPKLLVFDMRTDRVVSILFYCNYFTMFSYILSL